LIEKGSAEIDTTNDNDDLRMEDDKNDESSPTITGLK
jgi:hypothetical protein